MFTRKALPAPKPEFDPYTVKSVEAHYLYNGFQCMGNAVRLQDFMDLLCMYQELHAIVQAAVSMMDKHLVGGKENEHE